MASWRMAPRMTGIAPKLAASIRMTPRVMPPSTDCLATLMVRLEILMVRGIFLRLSAIMTTAAASLAAVEPKAASAILTSAAARTGASFTPSPMKALGFGSLPTMLTLSAGSAPA